MTTTVPGETTAGPQPAPTVGAAAPDVTLRDGEGADVRLSDLWQGAPRALALVFVRHFG